MPSKSVAALPATVRFIFAHANGHGLPRQGQSRLTDLVSVPELLPALHHHLQSPGSLPTALRPGDSGGF